MSSSKEAKAARRAKFEGVWKIIEDELVLNMQNERMPEEAKEWYRRVGIHILHSSIGPLICICNGRISNITSLAENSIEECL